MILLYGVAIKTGNYNSDTLKNMMKSEQEKLENLRKVIIEKYWREHPEEKERLESKKNIYKNRLVILIIELKILLKVFKFLL